MLCCPNSVVLSLLPPRTNPRLMNQSSAVRQKSQSWDPNLLALTWLTWVEAQLFFLTIQFPVSTLNKNQVHRMLWGNTTKLHLLINTAVHHTLQPIFAIFRYSSICDSTHRCWYVGLNQMLIFFKRQLNPAPTDSLLTVFPSVGLVSQILFAIIFVFLVMVAL